MTDVWEKLKTANKPIVLYGMGNGADKCIKICEEKGIKISGVFASDSFVRNKIFRGFEITNYQKKEELLGSMIVLVVFGSSLSDVIRNIEKIASKQELYAPDMPLFSDALFDLEFARSHRNELFTVYNMLEDEQSKKAFEGVCLYKITGDISYLKAIETSEDEAFENILKLGKNETFLDLGAYRGDTVFDFIKRVGDYDEIYAVEPDKKTFLKLEAATKELKKITLVNACVTEREEKVKFSSEGSRNSSVGVGNTEIDGITVDGLLEGKKVTYIKFDVEGSEEKAIIGATETVKTHKPKMLVSAYHKSEDMYSIPLQIKALRPDYKVYFRHYPYIPAWDTNFYFV